MDTRKARLHDKFGTIPEGREWKKTVETFYDLYRSGENEPVDGIDDITWQDLSMNEVFDRINQCDTSAGEEILYWQLRRNCMDPEERKAFEKRVHTFQEEEGEREAVEMLLLNIGKSTASYYIPSYMDAIEEYGMKHTWIYRGLQILLMVGLLLQLVFHTEMTGFFLGGVCLVNLVLYAVLKMKYEMELGMIAPATEVLEVGKKLAKRREIGEMYPELEERVRKFGSTIRGVHFLRMQKTGALSGDLGGVIQGESSLVLSA